MLNFENLRDLMSFIKKEEIKQVDLKFTNLFGGLHHISVPAVHIEEKIFREGIGFDRSSIPGFRGSNSSDMILIPDINNAFIDPFCDVKTISLFVRAYETHDRSPFLLDPRHIAERTERLLASKDFANSSFWGPEYEFYVFKYVSFKNAENISYYEIDAEEAYWNSMPESGTRSDGYVIGKGNGYHAIPPMDKLFEFRSNLMVLLENAGIEIKYHHHEGGSAGQIEFEVPFETLLNSADKGQIIKYFAKVLASKSGLTATFMPKPLYNEAGNGMHFHQFLTKDGKNVFSSEDKSLFNISTLALNYIGGILIHSDSLLGVTNPSTNSYKRLVKGFEAPVSAFYSVANRSAAIRIPGYATDSEEKRIEFRPSDSTGNIYLTESAMLLAGIDGIEKHIDPHERGFDNEENSKMLPTSLSEALSALESDREYLEKDGIFNEDFFRIWIENKRKDDIEIKRRVHPYEIELYYNC